MTNDQAPMTNEQTPGVERQSTRGSDKLPFDLGERTACYGERVIQFLLPVKAIPVRAPIISQLVRSSTSIGANYCEADEASSRKEFRYRIGVCCRKSRETKFWLRMLAAAIPEIKIESRGLWKEAG